MNNMDIKVRWATRPCTVKGKSGHFHAFEQYSQPVAASPFIGGEPAGVIARCYGLVEFDGKITRVEPSDIVFTDVLTEDEIL